MVERRIDDFLVVCTNKGLSKRTVQNYQHTLLLLHKYLNEYLQEKQHQQVQRKQQPHGHKVR